MSTTQRDEQGRIIPRQPDDPEAKVHLPHAGWFAVYEETEARRQYPTPHELEWHRRSWEGDTAGQLAMKMYQFFQEYKKWLKEHDPYKYRNDAEVYPDRYPEHEMFTKVLVEYEKLHAEQEAAAREKRELAKENLEKARQAARCQHIHTDGEQCGSPRMKDHTLCYMHSRMDLAAAAKLDLGPMEDADSIQLGIRKLQTAVIDGTLDASQVRQLAYLIQLAAWNVRGTLFGSRQRENFATDEHR